MSKKISCVVLLIFLFSISSFAQRFIMGSVTEVIDGKTIVIHATSGNDTTVQLQAIEIPEPEQQLFAAVKEHLQKLLAGKNVKVLFVQMMQNKMIGKVYLDNIDISAQILRDGAAWYNLPESNSHNQADRENYQAMEVAAKSEKRGIWGIENLKPAWEFRAEKERKKIERLAELEQIRQAEIEKAKSQDKKSSKISGLSQFDVSERRQNAEVIINQTATNKSEKEDEAIKISDAIEEMRDLLVRFIDGGVSFYSFKNSYFTIKRKVESATRNLAKGKLKLLMQENVIVLTDLGYVWELMNDKNYSFIDYRGTGKELADKYYIVPVHNNAGDYVITKQMIIDELVQKVLTNFVEIKKSASEQYGK